MGSPLIDRLIDYLETHQCDGDDCGEPSAELLTELRAMVQPSAATGLRTISLRQYEALSVGERAIVAARFGKTPERMLADLRGEVSRG